MGFFLVQLCGSLRSCTRLPSARFCLLLCLTVRTPPGPDTSLFGWPGTNCKQAAAAQGQFVRCVKIMKARVKWARVKRCRKRATGSMGKQRAKRSQSPSLSHLHTHSVSVSRSHHVQQDKSMQPQSCGSCWVHCPCQAPCIARGRKYCGNRLSCRQWLRFHNCCKRDKTAQLRRAVSQLVYAYKKKYIRMYIYI